MPFPDPTLAAIVTFVLLALFLAAGVHIGVALGMSGLVGLFNLTILGLIWKILM